MKGRGGRLTSPQEGETGATRRVTGKAPRPAVAAPSPRRPSPSDGDRDGLVLLGEFGRAHGLRGEVRLKSFTEDPRAIASYGPLLTDNGRRLTVKSPRPAPGGAPDLLVVQVEGIASREGAEALNRTRLYIERERLPAPDDQDEFLLADLIGLPVLTPGGEIIGKVVGVPNYGGGDLLEIAPAGGGTTALLPFTRAFVPEVDISGRRIVADPPEDLFAPPGPPDEP